uniref:Uncharacterized protein n=1 Tax=Xiphophorus couchianus TaxID=32473 RepID=A0A3B5LBD6_9TELE
SSAICGPSSDDPLHHLQLPLSVTLLLPALHFAEGRTIYPHWNLPDPAPCHPSFCRFVCDERILVWIRLHPGMGGLPSGAHQWAHLCRFEEARMKSAFPRIARPRSQPPTTPCSEFLREIRTFLFDLWVHRHNVCIEKILLFITKYNLVS